MIALAARGQETQLDVGVRSTVVDKPFGKSGLQAVPEHGKVYAILAVQLIPEEEKMIKPVDASVLASRVHHELDAHGFRPARKGEKPDILLTVQYGRAWLFNPYFGDEQTHQTQVDGPTIRDISLGTHTSPRQTQAGFESKAQKAEREKLCIKVTAWQYFPDPKAKARQLWFTLMNVDDPDHRDLNAIAAKMLEAGSPYFGREIEEEEVDVYKPVPDGRVNVGTPEVVEPPPAKTK